MSNLTLTLTIPERLYAQLKRRASQANRSVEDETLEVLVAAIPVETLSPDLEEAISALSLLDDIALWRAARSHLAAEAATALAELHDKRQREGLTEAEAQAVAALLRQYERALLVRAQAAALLKQRGHDVSGLTSGQLR